MNQDDKNSNNSINLVDFVNSFAQTDNNPKPRTFVPVTFSRSQFDDNNQEEDGIGRNDLGDIGSNISMKFKPVSFNSGPLISFTKAQSTNEVPKKFSTTPDIQRQDFQTKLTVSEVEQFTKPLGSNNSTISSRGKYGIGAALLKKMGYVEGKGLGVNNQGITEPIKQDIRQNGKGLDISRRNKFRIKEAKLHTSDISDDEFSSDEENAKSVWTEPESPELYNVIIGIESLGIDIPDTIKEICNNERLIGPRVDKSVEISVLTEKLNKIKEELSEVIATKKQAQFKILELKDLRDHLELNAQGHQAIYSKFKIIGDIITSQSPINEKSQLLKQQIQQLQTLEIKTYDNNIERFLIMAVKPLLSELFEDWDPLDISTNLLSQEIMSWKELLLEFTPSFGELSYFQTMLYSLWYPKIYEALKDWPVNKPNLPITVLMDWIDIIDDTVMDEFLENVISLHIIHAIRDWKFGEDNPPYIWIFEWIPYLGLSINQIKEEFTIRYNACVDDMIGSIEGLNSFKEIVGEPNFDLFINKKVIPKLCSLLVGARYDFNSKFNPEVFRILIFWKDYITSFETLLSIGFFNSWFKSLFLSLDTKYSNYEKISKNLSNWYLQFVKIEVQYPIVREKFNQALDMINKFIDLGRLEPLHRSISQSELISVLVTKSSAKNIFARKTMHVTFLEIVEDFCYKHGLLLQPLSNDLSSGKKLYQIKKNIDNNKNHFLTVYVDQDVLFVKNGSQFNPISLDNLHTLL
ncbi:hypothetical protein WICMUC_004747 [Wickerhamomyces mucosus]|uniref:G-patch domain-containing protein n=1 Tax=Wickerhamomyces mucosus TaxID=1378264 RepID=A0A9P8PGP4_9ASCO|nr:hypothetical protein WICMUC_004747 [Wickerhamomyces mucosus]